jgi:hypothetical protein
MTARVIPPRTPSITLRNCEDVGSGTNSMIGPIDNALVSSSREWLPLSYDVGIGHVSVAKARIGDRQHEEAETESVSRCVPR